MATITYVGTGTGATANNASVTPVVAAGTAVGDFVVVIASIRNSGTGDVNLPAGWSSLVYSGHHRIMAKIWDGVAIPAITFTAGAAGDDTIGQTFTLRGVSAEMLLAMGAPATLLNSSAANVLYPALTVAKDRHLALITGWKQSDGTAATTPAGFTAASNSLLASVAGNDAVQFFRYQIQTTAANVSSGTITMTGGVSAISRAIVLALKPAATITAVQQDAYPPRVLISVTDLTLGDSITLFRLVGGVRTPVRAGASTSVVDPSFLRVDAELPFGVPVSYIASVNGIEYATAPVVYTLPGGQVALSDAVTGAAAEVVIRAWPDKTYDRESTTFHVGGRNVVVTGDIAGFTGAVELYTETTAARDALMALLAVATGSVIQIRQPGGYDGVDSYVAVLRVTERRWSQDGSDDRRLITLDVVETESWAATLEARGFTYADLEAAYTGLTYANVESDYGSYLLLAQADLS